MILPARHLLGALVAGWLAAAAAAPAPAPRTPAGAGRPRAAAPAVDALERDTLAWVDQRAITAQDLVQRIEWMPWPEKHGAASMDSARTRALESLVAEALLAGQGERQAGADSARIMPMRAALRRALLRDALFRQVVAAVPQPTPAQVQRIVNARYPRATLAQQRGLRRSVADSLRALGGSMRAADFLLERLAGRSVRVDSATFMLLADSLRAIMLAGGEDPLPGTGYRVPPEAADGLHAQLQPALRRTLAHLPDGALTLGDAIDDLHFYLFAVRSLERRAFAIEFNECLRHVVEGELMAREAARRGLDRRHDLQRELARWTDAWRAAGLTGRILSGIVVDDDEAIRQLALKDPDRARRICEVDVAEVLSGSGAQAQNLLGELMLGARFDSVAARRTLRHEWAAAGGRSGFFPVAAHPELGYAALLAPPDTLVGPIRLPEGFAILRVHGKRIAADSAAGPALLERARAIGRGERSVQVLSRYVADLANRASVRIDYAALRRVGIAPANMVVKRSLGFGGGMTASPSLAPLWQWTRDWSGRDAPRP